MTNIYQYEINTSGKRYEFVHTFDVIITRKSIEDNTLLTVSKPIISSVVNLKLIKVNNTAIPDVTLACPADALTNGIEVGDYEDRGIIYIYENVIMEDIIAMYLPKSALPEYIIPVGNITVYSYGELSGLELSYVWYSVEPTEMDLNTGSTNVILDSLFSAKNINYGIKLGNRTYTCKSFFKGDDGYGNPLHGLFSKINVALYNKHIERGDDLRVYFDRNKVAVGYAFISHTNRGIEPIYVYGVDNTIRSYMEVHLASRYYRSIEHMSELSDIQIGIFKLDELLNNNGDIVDITINSSGQHVLTMRKYDKSTSVTKTFDSGDLDVIYHTLKYALSLL